MSTTNDEIKKTNVTKNTNYTVMLLLTIFGCMCGFVTAFGPVRLDSFGYMLCVFPMTMIIGAALGWFLGGVISKSSLNPFTSLRSLQITLGLIGSIFGLSFGLYLVRWLRDNLCPYSTGASGICSGDAFEITNTFLFSAIPMCVLPLAIIGLLIGIAIASILKRTKR